MAPSKWPCVPLLALLAVQLAASQPQQPQQPQQQARADPDGWSLLRGWEARLQKLLQKQREDQTRLLDRAEMQQRHFETDLQHITQEAVANDERVSERRTASLSQHAVQQRNLLATWERDILAKLQELRESYGVTRTDLKDLEDLKDAGDSTRRRGLEAAFNDVYVLLQAHLRRQRIDQDEVMKSWQAELATFLDENKKLRDKSVIKISKLQEAIRIYENTVRKAQLHMALVWQEANLVLMRKQTEEMSKLIHSYEGKA